MHVLRNTQKALHSVPQGRIANVYIVLTPSLRVGRTKASFFKLCSQLPRLWLLQAIISWQGSQGASPPRISEPH